MIEQQNFLLARIEESKNLPTLPHILLKLIEVCNKEKAGIKDLTEIINKDPSISEKVLRLVNSAYYSLNQKVASIDQAIVLLGMDAIMNIAISASIYQVFNKADGKTFNLKVFWWHSLSCAVTARLLAKKVRYPSPDEAFLSGLLHDIGKVILWVNFKEEYGKILEAAKFNTTILLNKEAELGITHSEVGAWLLNKWNMHSFIPDAVQFHHDSFERVLHSSLLVQIVYTANILSSVIQEEYADHFNRIDRASELLNLDADEVKSIILETESEVNEIAETLDVDIELPRESEILIPVKEDEKTVQLASEVMDVSLIHSALKGILKAENGSDVLKIIRQGIQTWFNTKIVFFFQYSNERLIGKSMGKEDFIDLIRGLSIPFKEQGSIFVQTLIQDKPLNSINFGKHNSFCILDRQILRIIGGESLLCFPLKFNDHYLGVLALSCTQEELETIRKRMKLLTVFLNQAVLALHTHSVRESQALRIQDERISASSDVIRKIVHEVNNPLGIINNYLGVLSSKLDIDKPAQDALGIIKEEISRISLILKELSDLSSSPSLQIETVDVNSLISDLAKIFKEALRQKSKIGIKLTLKPDLPVIHSNRNKIKQVLINLIKNAAEAIVMDGTIHIKTNSTEESIEIRIHDTGPGIPEEIRKQVFEPFISSKGHDGLGLSIVYNSVKELKGTIVYETNKKTGTEFILLLPVKPS